MGSKWGPNGGPNGVIMGSNWGPKWGLNRGSNGVIMGSKWGPNGVPMGS